MSDKRQSFRHRVCGFGNHIEQQTVEFTKKVDEVHVCSWCGVVSAKSCCLSCFHIVCEECLEDANKAAVTVCWIDKQNLNASPCTPALKSMLEKKNVRCLNVGSGCNYTGYLGDLNHHLSKDCALYRKECCKCEESMAFKELVGHFRTCKGVEGVLVRAADGQSLLEDMRNARKELQQGLASTSSDVRVAVGILTEQIGRLRSQLTASSEGEDDDVTWHYCNQ
ncbi:E3 ubiquitin-protein ligase NRDP1-like [Dermacentor variabilis]|uniref:E3 ubiquitin-protein ligase NRDP1-like n=1 Tax=Dermacentor variabilis TaxID=34621 RepID=UPI003F5BAED1